MGAARGAFAALSAPGAATKAAASGKLLRYYCYYYY